MLLSCIITWPNASVPVNFLSLFSQHQSSLCHCLYLYLLVVSFSSFLNQTSLPGLWGDHPGGFYGQGLPCGVLPLWGEAPFPHTHTHIHDSSLKVMNVKSVLGVMWNDWHRDINKLHRHIPYQPKLATSWWLINKAYSSVELLTLLGACGLNQTCHSTHPDS